MVEKLKLLSISRLAHDNIEVAQSNVKNVTFNVGDIVYPKSNFRLGAIKQKIPTVSIVFVNKLQFTTEYFVNRL